MGPKIHYVTIHNEIQRRDLPETDRRRLFDELRRQIPYPDVSGEPKFVAEGIVAEALTVEIGKLTGELRELAEAARERLKPTGPLYECTGPHDYEGQGRSAYWDTPEDQRAKFLSKVLEDTKPFTPSPDQEFARGWLSEHYRATHY